VFFAIKTRGHNRALFFDMRPKSRCGKKAIASKLNGTAMTFAPTAVVHPSLYVTMVHLLYSKICAEYVVVIKSVIDNSVDKEQFLFSAEYLSNQTRLPRKDVTAICRGLVRLGMFRVCRFPDESVPHDAAVYTLTRGVRLTAPLPHPPRKRRPDLLQQKSVLQRWISATAAPITIGSNE
jgi:hypothetical protein